MRRETICLTLDGLRMEKRMDQFEISCFSMMAEAETKLHLGCRDQTIFGIAGTKLPPG